MTTAKNPTVSVMIDEGHGFRVSMSSGTLDVDVDLSVTCCMNPDCDCRDVFVYLEPANSGAWGEPTDEVKAVVDIDSGDIVRCTDGCTPQLRGSLDGLLRNGPLLAYLRERWRRIKLLGDPEAWRKQDWSWWEPGLMVGWRDAYPGDFDETVEVDANRYVVDESYCSTPKCPCKDVVLSFSPIPVNDREPPRTDPLFVDIGKWRVTGENGDSLTQLQRTLWEAYARIPGAKKRLRQRNNQIREIGRKLHREFAPTKQVQLAQGESGKIGRNAPCPCGSGKKYKRCCGVSA